MSTRIRTGSLDRRPLQAGDRVRLVSPASPPVPANVERCARIFESWGLQVEFGAHAFAQHGYLAGPDADRLADLNAALRDPGVRAIFATTGGKGAYRIADQLDFEAAARHRPVLVGFSDISALHLALWHRCHVPGLHGPLSSWSDAIVDAGAVDALHRALMTPDPIVLTSRLDEETASLSTSGRAVGPLIGGNLDTLAITAGWALPCLAEAILFLEGATMGLGHIDRQLTMLRKGGHLDGVCGVAIGQFTNCSRHEPWGAIDVLSDHLGRLGVPLLGGLPLGHGQSPRSVPIGCLAELDADAGVLTVAAIGAAHG
jgi:muramoyltetrapeptide carboxypeptidase